MATSSNILAWKLPWTVEPGRLQSMESKRDITEQARTQWTGPWTLKILWWKGGHCGTGQLVGGGKGMIGGRVSLFLRGGVCPQPRPFYI